ncbi:MAG: serine/threonine protein kinase [Sandaracinus sp.]|nr:serine/threonine protein kinase [Sandaracinus sp.]MCB9621905.1 serine/threonine protein kinase [Sandaracinus sp.]MCB9636580.1 serine/threonine protein kinase [Sandaracinus sp.]
MSVPVRLGSYEILAEIKSGGMATLYLGKRSGPAGFSRHVAIKVLKDHLATQGELVKMFIDEARIASRIDHPNVVRIEELGEEDGRFFLVMEYVHGAALSELLTKLSSLQRRLHPTAAVALVMAGAEGLHAAHETRDDSGKLLNVVHRDVSPQNVLVGVGGEVKVIDFGIAKARDRLHTTEAGSGLKGKLRYMAPEQLQRGPLDRRADVYALGVVLWEMLTMRRLFQGMSDPQVVQRVLEGRLPPPSAYVDVPMAVENVVMRALSRDPEKRPPTGRALREQLKEALPEAARVEGTEVSALLFALLGDEIAERAAALPSLRLGLDTREAIILPERALEQLSQPLDQVTLEGETLVTEQPLVLSQSGVTPYMVAGQTEGGGFDSVTAAPTVPETRVAIKAPHVGVTPSAPSSLAPPPPARSGVDGKSVALLLGGLVLGALLAAGLLLALQDDEPPPPVLVEPQ